MSVLQWVVVFLLNGGIVLYSTLGSKRSESSQDWFLGGRSVPWWIVGISAFATAIDSSDLVADSGGIYSLGIRYFVTNWVGTVTGWLLLAHFVAIPMYRSGMYTNSEYLEQRFGLSTRVCSSLVQVQYRTMVMANISTTLYLTFTVVGGMGREAWIGVFVVVALSLVYTIWGGSRSVAVTDVLQSVVMIAASLILFGMVSYAVGGWSGTASRLASVDPQLAPRMLRIGSDYVETVPVSGVSIEEVGRQLLLGGSHDESAEQIVRKTPAWLICISFILVGMAYSIVNHEQSMRLFASKSAWDMKMSVVVASLLLMIMTYFNLMMGVMGRALYPTLESLPVSETLQQTADPIYPILVRDFTSGGLKVVVIAGLLAAAISTYAGIGSAMSALLTKDIYARLLVKNASDKHYLLVGRWLTLLVALGAFAYVPFLLTNGMMMFYLDLVGAFVIPLLTIYLMGIFTRVHRKSGMIGLLVGVSYGFARLILTKLAVSHGISLFPPVFLNSFASYPITVLLTTSSMVIVSLVLGWEPATQTIASNDITVNQSSFLGETPSESRVRELLPSVLGITVLVIGAGLSFILFW